MTLRNGLLALVSLLLGAVLLLMLVRASGVDAHLLLREIRNTSPSAFTILFLLNGLLAWLSTAKWRLVDTVLRGASDSAVPKTAAFALTSAGMALGLVLPVQIAMTVARTLGTYFYGRPVQRGTAGTLFEQSFDLFAICSLSVASLITWLCHGAAATWTLCAAAIAFFSLASVGIYARIARAVLAAAARQLGLASRLARVSEFLDCGVLHPSLARRLLALSLIRFVVLVLMGEQTARAVGAPIALWQMFVVIPFAAIANLVALTPGGLGLNELTSSAVLVRFGVPLRAAAGWSVANRVLITGSCLAVAICAAGMSASERLYRNRARSEVELSSGGVEIK